MGGLGSKVVSIDKGKPPKAKESLQKQGEKPVEKPCGDGDDEEEVTTPPHGDPQEVVKGKLNKAEEKYTNFDQEFGHYIDAEKAYQELVKRIKEAGVESRVVIKYIVVDLAFFDNHPLLRWLVSRVVQTGDGFVHTALQVGPQVLHWFNSSLVYMKEWHSEEAILALDVGTLDLNLIDDQARLKKLAELMVKWNTTKEYDRCKSSCQQFVSEAVESLGMNFDKESGAVGKYLKQLRNGEKVPMSYNGIIFNTHAELDTYCWENYDQQDESAKALLKAFDRAFWLRDRHQEDNADPSLHDANLKPSNCFFKDPAITGTAPKQSIGVLKESAKRCSSSAKANLPPIRILCLDGGGMRGVILVELIRQIEKRMGAPLDQLFDLVAGTSTGGILAGALAFKMVKDIDAAQKLYFELGEKVFGYRFGNLALGAINVLRQGNGVFRSDALKQIIEQYAGDKALTELHDYVGPKVFVVSARKNVIQGKREAYIFRSYVMPDGTGQEGKEEEEEEEKEKHAGTLCSHQHTGSSSHYYHGTTTGKGIKLVDALLATSAAPYYLDSVMIGKNNFVDGGVVANNPSEIAFLEAMRLWPDRRIVVISLGTGLITEDTGKEKKKASSSSSFFPSSSSKMPRSVEPLLDIVALATNSELINSKLHDWLQVMRKQERNRFRLVRLNPPCPDFDLAAYEKEDLTEMIKFTTDYLAASQGKRLLDEVHECLEWPDQQLP